MIGQKFLDNKKEMDIDDYLEVKEKDVVKEMINQ